MSNHTNNKDKEIKSSIISYVPENLQPHLTIKKYPDLTIHDIDEVNKGIFVFDSCSARTGIYYENGDLCKSSVLLRFSDTGVESVNKIINKCDFVNETVIYLGTGYVFEHFGHFLIEGVNRFWPLLYPKYKNFKVVIASYDKNIRSFVRKALNAMGVQDKNIIIINKNTQFAKVLVPHQSSQITVNVLPITKLVYNKIAKSLKDKNIDIFDKIYMSRSAMNDGRTFGEKQIENIFAKNGYKIIHPEKLPLEQQITLAAGCKEMAGAAGSALHLSAFMKKGGRVIQIKRNSDVSDNINIQSMINDVAGLDTIFVYGSIEKYKTEHFTTAPQIMGITPYMLKFFKDYKFKYDQSDIVFDATELKKYKNKLRIYKIHKLYSKIIDFPIRIISVFGITRSAREKIREFLRKMLNY